MRSVKYLFVALVIATLHSELFAEDAAALPPAADAAISKYNSEVAKAKSEMDKRVDVAKAALIQVLSHEQEAQTKAGKLDSALAIRSKIDALKKGASPGDTDTAADPSGLDFLSRSPGIPPVSRVPLGKAGIKSAFMLGPFPKGTDSAPILAYLSDGDFKKPYLGISIQRVAVDASGNLNCPNQDNSDFYWVVYVKSSDKQVINAALTVQANPADHTNSSEAFYDGKPFTSGGKIEVSTQGDVIILHQMHNASYFNSWFRFLAERPIMVAP